MKSQCVFVCCCIDPGDGNVTAATDGARSLAVLVFVHGESYDIGSGNAYDCSLLAVIGRLVVITLNYRLGILGIEPLLSTSGFSVPCFKIFSFWLSSYMLVKYCLSVSVCVFISVAVQIVTAARRHIL